MRKYSILFFFFLLSWLPSLAQATFEYDAAGNRIKRNVIGVPDLAPTIQTFLGYVHAGVEPITLVIHVYQLASTPTTGVVTAYVAKDPSLVDFLFNPTATFIGGQMVQNASWTFDNSHPDFYIFTTSDSIPADDVLSFGISGQAKKGFAQSLVSFTVVTPAMPGEINLTNNSNATFLTYFP